MEEHHLYIYIYMHVTGVERCRKKDPDSLDMSGNGPYGLPSSSMGIVGLVMVGMSYQMLDRFAI